MTPKIPKIEKKKTIKVQTLVNWTMEVSNVFIKVRMLGSTDNDLSGRKSLKVLRALTLPKSMRLRSPVRTTTKSSQFQGSLK